MPAMRGTTWRCLLAAVLLLAVGCGSGAPATPTATPAPTATSRPLPTATPLPSPTAVPAKLVVGNTGGDGVWLRRSAPAGEKVRAWLDGTEMMVAGADQVVDGRTWKNVKDPAGNVGWIPADYLVLPKPGNAANPTPTPKR